MATDSLKFVNENYVNRIHGTAPSGKLHKGHNVTAATASIPSTYQTIVIDNSEKKGFASRSKRFQYDSAANDHPGPGNYIAGGVTNNHTSPSVSKKGTGSFASKDKRISKLHLTYSPGAGAYSLPSMLVTKQDHNKSTSTSSFHRPIAVYRDKGGNPAPNEYNVTESKTSTGKANNVAANAAFKSQSRRELLNMKEESTKPSPWQYHVKEDLVRDAIKVPMSSFKSKTVRNMQGNPPAYPGPGTYKPHEEVDPVQKIIFPRKHYLCISAPAMPLPDTPPAPGPGSYEVVNYDGEPKHYMSSAAFVSTTSRWTGGEAILTTQQPGPAHYRPVNGGKQSFIYNAANKWI